MSDRPKFFDDLAGVAGGAMSAFAGLREEMMAAMRARMDETVRRMDLVKRDEFDAVAEMARRAREESDSLALRVAALEGRLAGMAAAEPVTPVAEVDEVGPAEPVLHAAPEQHEPAPHMEVDETHKPEDGAPPL
jgi:BMFP domain-containing protein YqiC